MYPGGVKIIPTLSKSRFLAGLQCHLRLWYECYSRDLASEVSPSQQAIFDMGHDVGRLATKLYPGGILIEDDHLHHEEAVRSTLAAMENPDVRAIFEAAFIFDGVRVRVDILERLNDGGWNMIEVKSSTSVKDVYLPDVAVQLYVLQGSGLQVERAILMHINNKYIYDGNQLDLEGFFKSSDLTDQAEIMQDEVLLKLSEMKDMLGKDHAPRIEPSRHCHNPYDCEFLEYCTREMPEYWVMNLSGITEVKLNELKAMGVDEIGDIPSSFPLTGIQERIRKCVIEQKEYISAELEQELNDVMYPIHFLDFETVGPAIPRFAGTRPYETIPFQWSDHILSESGALDHKEYLCLEDKDPREEFVLSLIEALGTEGTVFIYTNYETRIIRALADHMPEYSERLHAVIDRFKDLHAIMRKQFYHLRFKGSFSLKAVLPALVHDMDYNELAIQEGGQASFEYLRMMDPSTTGEEKERIKKELLTYCGYDTMAMVKIRDTLLKRF